MSTVLATGGLGFVGSHCCVELINNGFDVCIVDSLINSSEQNLYKIKKILETNKCNNKGKLYFKKGDVKNHQLIDNIFKEFRDINKPILMVLHFAGLKAVEESVKNPLKYWDENVNSAISLLSIMNKNNCKNIVFSSSATIYKPVNDKKLVESSFKEPINAYGNSKLTIEKILNDLANSEPNKWRIANLRYFNPAGAHESGLIGEDPLKIATNLFPIILDVAIKKKDRLYIFGNDWPTKDGTCIRDYIHIMDLANAHVSAIDFLLKNKPQEISINIGNGKGYSVLEVVNTFMKVNKIKLHFQFEERRKGDPAYVVADNKLALSLLDWKPRKSLEDMCIDSWRWIKNR